jgi:hypothetical protein
MIAYMSNYNVWASNGFPSGNFKNYLQNIENNKNTTGLVPSLEGIYSGGNYPTNPFACP